MYLILIYYRNTDVEWYCTIFMYRTLVVDNHIAYSRGCWDSPIVARPTTFCPGRGRTIIRHLERSDSELTFEVPQNRQGPTGMTGMRTFWSPSSPSVSLQSWICSDISWDLALYKARFQGLQFLTAGSSVSSIPGLWHRQQWIPGQPAAEGGIFFRRKVGHSRCQKWMFLRCIYRS